MDPETTTTTTGSPPFSLSTADWASITKGALIAASGAGGLALLHYFDAIDYGAFDGAVASGIAILINLLRKYTTDTQE